MRLSANQLEEKYYDIYNTYQGLLNQYKYNLLSIGQVLKHKYTDFQTKYVKLFRKILANQITEDYIKNMIAIHEKNIDDKKLKLFEQNNPDVYKTICDGDILNLLQQIQIIRTNINEYKDGYKQDYLNAKGETKSTFFRKYRTLLTHNRYKALFKGWINNTMPHDVTLALLSSYDKMQRNELSEQDAATAYSQHIVDGYIKPTLNQ